MKILFIAVLLLIAIYIVYPANGNNNILGSAGNGNGNGMIKMQTFDRPPSCQGCCPAVFGEQAPVYYQDDDDFARRFLSAQM